MLRACAFALGDNSQGQCNVPALAAGRRYGSPEGGEELARRMHGVEQQLGALGHGGHRSKMQRNGRL